MSAEKTLSRDELLHIAKWVLFKTSSLFASSDGSEESFFTPKPDESKEVRDRHWQRSTMQGKRRLLIGLARGLSEVGIEVEDRRAVKSGAHSETPE